MSTNMAVSSIKGCWYKFSARIRDYLDVVDSYYRPPEGEDPSSDHHHHPHHHHPHQENSKRLHHSCDRVTIAKEGMVANSSSGGGGSSGNSSGTTSKRNRGHNIGGSIGISSNSSRHHQHHQGCTEQVAKHFQQQVSRTQLPPGYTKRKTSLGQVYFVDQNGHKYWYDPSVPKELHSASLNLDSLVGRLSLTWEIRQTLSGKTYYVNHIKKTTQFTDPRLVAYKDHLMTILRHAKGTLTTQTANTSSGQQQATPSSRQSNPSATNGNGGGQPSSANALRNSGYNPLPVQGSTANDRICLTCSQHTSNSDNQRSATLTLKYTDPSLSARLRRHIRSLHNPNGTLRSQSSSNTSNRHSKTTQKETTGGRGNQNNNQYHMNLLSGSHHNLSTMTQHPNTLTGPPPAWFRPSSLVGLKRQSQEQGYAVNAPVGPPASAGSCINPSQVAHDSTTTSRSDSHNFNSGGSVTNLFPLSANTTIATSPNTTINTTISSSTDQTGQAHHHIKSKRELYDKISILRQELLKQQVIAHPCRIDINRKRIFEESFRVVSQMQSRDLKKRLLIKFRGEEGLDYGGVAREWFYLLSRELLNPNHGLFQYTSDDIYNLQINPDSGIVYREHLSYLNFCGRVIGMAVFHGHFIEGHFTLPFYKMLLGKSINLGDIENVDSDLYRSLCWILENDITNVIDTTFLVQHNAFGQLQEHELKENGRNIVVTEANKQEYVSLYISYRCRRGIGSQFEALQRGFYELIQPSLLDNFDEHELELLIGGLSKINIEDWRLHTKLKNCTVDTPLVRWFWDIVKSYDEDKRARLLQFVTGSPRVPIQGFKALQGVNSELRLFTIHLIKNACTDNLPKSHTCFNRIDLPPYETYEKLRDKLTQAIEETMGFAMQ